MSTPPIFDPTVPERLSDSFATSQQELRDNFQSLFNVFAVNHVAMNEPNAGNHTFINLLEQANPILTDLNEIAIYTKDVEGQTDQIFFRYQGSGQEFQFTNYQLFKLQAKKNFTAFFTFLPGRIIVYFGSFPSITGIASQIVKLEPQIATNIIGITVCANGQTATRKDPQAQTQVHVIDPIKGIYTELQFNLAIGGGVQGCFYMVVANT